MNIKNESVVITGGTGFIGRHLATELREAGAKVHALGRADYDLRDRAQIDVMLKELTPAVVIHLASVEGGIGANESEPGRFFYENALMGIEMIDACRRAGVDKTVIAGTVSSYPAGAQLPFTEDEFWAGYPHETNAPYALAKKMLLVQTQAYRKQYGMNIVYLIPTNVYGPGDRYDAEASHVIPAMIARFVEARESRAASVTLWGDGSATREFLYVGDAARALRLAVERFDRGYPVNVGSGDEISIRELARRIQTLTNYDGDIHWDTSRPNGPPRRNLYTSLAFRDFQFEATTALDDGLATTVAWFENERRNLEVSDPAR